MAKTIIHVFVEVTVKFTLVGPSYKPKESPISRVSSQDWEWNDDVESCSAEGIQILTLLRSLFVDHERICRSVTQYVCTTLYCAEHTVCFVHMNTTGRSYFQRLQMKTSNGCVIISHPTHLDTSASDSESTNESDGDVLQDFCCELMIFDHIIRTWSGQFWLML